MDCVVFTAGVGENSDIIKAKCCEKLDFLGISIDPEKNNKAVGIEAEITTENSKIKALAIPTNEELIIAEDTFNIVNS